MLAHYCKSSQMRLSGKHLSSVHLFHMNLIGDIKVANFPSGHKKKKYFKQLIYLHYTINYEALDVI